MKLDGGNFETEIDCEGYFAISITQESDYSTDGGYTFEDETNTFWINKSDAKLLIEELLHYINN